MKGYFYKINGIWAFKVDVGVDPKTGKRKQKNRSGFKRKKDAEEACRKLLAEHQEGSAAIHDSSNFGQFINHWLENIYKHNVTASTYTAAKSKFKSRIVPSLGMYKLHELKGEHIELFISEMHDNDFKSDYVLTLYKLVNNVLNVAVRRGFITKNPCLYVEAPKRIRRQETVWSYKEVMDVLLYLKDSESRYYTAVYLAAMTGVRRSELIGLKWEDVYWKEHKIRVNKSLHYVNENDYHIVDTKTPYSRRLIQVDEQTMNVLKKEQIRQSKFKLQYGEYYKGDRYICCREDGVPLNPRGLYQIMLRIHEETGIKKIRFHDIRHSHATILLKNGENPKVIQERLGHSSISVTLDIYSHVMPDMQKDTMLKFHKESQK